MHQKSKCTKNQKAPKIKDYPRKKREKPKKKKIGKSSIYSSVKQEDVTPDVSAMDLSNMFNDINDVSADPYNTELVKTEENVCDKCNNEFIRAVRSSNGGR